MPPCTPATPGTCAVAAATSDAASAMLTALVTCCQRDTLHLRQGRALAHYTPGRETFGDDKGPLYAMAGVEPVRTACTSSCSRAARAAASTCWTTKAT